MKNRRLWFKENNEAGDAMRVWTFANQKGGIGKTTTCVALGGLAADLGAMGSATCAVI